MDKKSIKIIISVIAIIVFLALVYLIYKNQFQADSNGNIFYGTVYQGQQLNYVTPSNTVSGIEIILVCNDPMPGTAKYQGTSGSDGKFAIPITNPKPCDYKILAGGNGYNYIDSGSVNFVNNDDAMGPFEEERLVYVEKEIDLIHSNYFGHTYPDGYHGSYLLSVYDYSYFRNPVTFDKITNPQSPSGAKVTIPVSVVGLWCDEGGNDEVFNVNLKAYSINSNWISEPSTSAQVAEKSFQLSCQNRDLSKIEVDINLTSIGADLRYYTWMNGFRFDTEITPTKDPNLAAPFFSIPRSEDNGGQPVVSIEYTGLENYKTDTGHGFVGEVVSPVDGQGIVSSDYGNRSRPDHQNWCHRGIDYIFTENRNIYSVNAGIVIQASYGSNGGFGNLVVVKHCNDMFTWYGHFESLSVSAGQVVKAGQLLGIGDSTGMSTGHHLHFSVAYGNETNYTDPVIYLKHTISSISVDEFSGFPRRNKGLDLSKRKEYLRQDSCIINKGWNYD